MTLPLPRPEAPVEQEGAALPRYVIVTCARDEAASIRKTLDAVVGQTWRPARWVIVDDSSKDDTGAIVAEYAAKHAFITPLRLEQQDERNFSGKIQAFRRGLEALRGEKYTFLGNLDADISMEPGYYARILAEFKADPSLGICGGIVFTRMADHFVTTDYTDSSVAGAIQLFSRPCFEATGGYPAFRGGGEDAAAEIRARMLGWTVRKLPEVRVLEHRRTGSATASPLTACLRDGRRFRSLGYDPLFYALRCVYRLGDRPYVIGALASLTGYLQAALDGTPILLEPDVVTFLRGEQRQRLRSLRHGLVRRSSGRH